MAPAHFVLKKATQNQLCCKTALLASQPAHHVAQGIAAEKGNQGGAAIHKERPILHTSKGPLAMVELQGCRGTAAAAALTAAAAVTAAVWYLFPETIVINRLSN